MMTKITHGIARHQPDQASRFTVSRYRVTSCHVLLRLVTAVVKIVNAVALGIAPTFYRFYGHKLSHGPGPAS